MYLTTYASMNKEMIKGHAAEKNNDGQRWSIQSRLSILACQDLGCQ